MFELSFGEILLFTTVALVVLGPERLPALARFLGRSVAKVQNLINNVKAEMTAEVGLKEFQDAKNQLQESAQSVTGSWKEEAARLQKIQQDFEQDLKKERESLQEIQTDLQEQHTQLQNDWRKPYVPMSDTEESVPAWERLPEQKTPADFGIQTEQDDLMQQERAWVAEQQQNQGNRLQAASLSQQSRRRRKDVRPYQNINRHVKHIGARRQDKTNRHG